MISVVLPVADATWLVAQLGALTNQALDAPWELVLVEDGPVGPVDNALRQVPDLPALVRVPGPRRGSYAARNAGAARARGSLLVFCDADDVVDAGWLAGHGAALAISGLSTGPLDLERVNEPSALAGRDPDRWRRAPLVGNGFLPYAPACNLGVRREVFERLGAFPARHHGGDKALCWTAQLAGHELRFEPGAAVAYRLRSSTVSTLRRHYRIGRSAPSLYRAFRADGMRREGPIPVLRDAAAVARGVGRDAGARRTAAAVAAKRAGRLVGSLAERVWYP